MMLSSPQSSRFVTPQAVRYTEREQFLMDEEEKKQIKRIKRQEQKKKLDKELRELKWKCEKAEGQCTLSQFFQPLATNEISHECYESYTHDGRDSDGTPAGTSPVVLEKPTLTPEFCSIFSEDQIPMMPSFNDWCTKEEEKRDAEILAKLAVKANLLGKKEVCLSQLESPCAE